MAERKIMTEDQIKNWRKVFPMLVFLSDEFVERFVVAVQARIDADLHNLHIRREIAAKAKSNFFNIIRIGTKFVEDGTEKTVTRITDIVFDSANNVTGEIQVRNLSTLKSAKAQNSISIISL